MNRKRIWLRVLLVLGVMVVVALVVGGLWLARIGISAVGDLTSGAISLHAELDEARSEGVPLEPSDIRPSPPVPPHRNAAPFLREMGELYWAQSEPERNGTGVIIKAVGSPTRSNADRQEARDWLERRSRLIELAEKAGSMPDCDMEKPYEQGLAVEFREVAGAR
ncbi:MAG: hypothetical protein FJX72_12900, partial [Armatimonadetes bacterium]|nr:hypothetical protein [Armatimonadota bacterium]